DLLLCVSGAEGDEAYGTPCRVNLRFDPDLWPAKLPLVRFRGVFHHALTDDNGAMLMPFYRALPRDERDACTLRLTVQAIHNFLVEPFASWKLPAERLPEKFQRSLDIHRKMNAERLEIIRKYRPQALHADLFRGKWKDEWLEPAFVQARKQNSPEAWRQLVAEHMPGVYSFKLITDAFCDMFLEEVFNFYQSGLPARRPNSMNAYGIILNDIGMEPLIDELQRMLQPLGDLFFPGPGNCWDGHHCFIVRYRSGEDLGLDMHTDDSDVTFNLCLGLDFAGAGLQFCGMTGATDHRKHQMCYKHRKGHCVFHLGRRRHGADDITSGERLNLILWNHSSTYRTSDESEAPEYNAESGPPDAVCVSYTHDRDFGNFKEYPKGKEHFRGRGWCPRKRLEYPGFEPDCESEEEVVGSTAEAESRRASKEQAADAILTIFTSMDSDGSGLITKDEFATMKYDSQVMSALRDLGIKDKQFDVYVQLLFQPTGVTQSHSTGDSVAMGLEALVEALCPGPRASMWIEVSVPVVRVV
ncbi:unnamed protein product, partial [Effrenium voratum]